MEYLYGTLHVAVDMDITEIHRVCLSQNGTHYAEMYYPDYTEDEIQKMQDLEQAQLDKAYEFGKQDAQPENKKLLAWQEDFQGYIKMLNLPRDDYKGIMEYINEVPSAQPIIRCKDCKWWSNDDYRECSSPNYDDGYVTPAGFYCGYAERRTDGSDR